MTPPRRGRDRGLVRPYVVTGGRSAPSRRHVDLITLVMSRRDAATSGLTPEERRVVDLCLPGALSVAEISSHLGLPPSVLRVVLADLLDSGHITSRTRTRNPSTGAAGPIRNRELLEAVLSGLRAL
ncbi:DUF742 domain-containing protein [Streptomyces sp. NPDC048639]|uniref:DUF742 domain-containing protein n=1 Tax=Streptomyces sp. NPDC048639 TaxID=3365581 RepID=UPI00371DF680